MTEQWERDFSQWGLLYHKNKITPELFNNCKIIDSGETYTQYGLQAVVRLLLHSLHYNRILHDEGTGDLAPSGAYNNIATADGYIMVVNDDGLSEIKYVAATTGNTLGGGTDDVLVCTKDGTIVVRANRASCLDTDIPIAGRRPADDALVNFRNMEKGDRKIYKAYDAMDVTQDITIGGELRTPTIYNAFGTSVVFDDNINMGEHAISNVTELYATTYYSNDNANDFIAIAGPVKDVILKSEHDIVLKTLADVQKFRFDMATGHFLHESAGKLGMSGYDWTELWVQSIGRTAGNITFKNSIDMNDNTIFNISTVQTDNLRSQAGAGTAIIMGSEVNMNGYDLQMNEVTTGGGDILMAGGSIGYLTKINGNVYFCNTQSELIAAITAIGTGTGLIIVHGLIEVASFTISAPLADITIIGTRGSGLSFAAGDGLIISECDSLTLRDLRFVSTHSNTTSGAIIGTLSTAASIRLTIDSCTIEHSSATSAKTGIFLNTSTTTSAKIIVNNCEFINLQRGFHSQVTASNEGPQVKITGNTFNLSPALTTISVFGIMTDSAKAIVANNKIECTSSLDAGAFYGIYNDAAGASAIIEGNAIHIEATGQTNTNYTVTGIHTEGQPCVINGNTIRYLSGYGVVMGIVVTEGDCSITGNSLLYITSTDNSAHGINTNGDSYNQVTGNYVRQVEATTVAIGISMYSIGVASGNFIYDVDGGAGTGYGIDADAQCAISSNTINSVTGTTNAYGIYALNQNSISANQVYNVTNSIYTGQICGISGNHVSGSITATLYCAISGNHVGGNITAGDYASVTANVVDGTITVGATGSTPSATGVVSTGSTNAIY